MNKVDINNQVILKEQNSVLVSIIMPAYNANKTLMQSINSVFNQTYTNFELIVVNDCSIDNTLDLLNSIIDPRVRIVNLKENSRVAKARNAGIALAKGKYIAFLDSDDIWRESKLEKQVRFMEDNNFKFTYTNYIGFIEDQKSNIIFNKKERIQSDCVDYHILQKSNQIGCLTVMIDSAIMKSYQMPNIGHEDYATWLNILKTENIFAYNVGETLAEYRIDVGSLSSNKFRAATWQWKIYREFLGLSFFKSSKNFLFYMKNGIIQSYE